MLAILLAAVLGGAAQAECPRAAALPCVTSMGTYRVASPQGDGPHPAVMFLHGAGGTGAGVLGMEDPIARLTHRGYVVLAPDGLPWRPGRTGGIWNFRSDLPREWPRDEAAFLTEVVADATARHAVDSARIVLSGFSAGAFMVNYLACATPDAFAAYAPVSGGFWRPHPEACAGPVRLLHTHGWRDSTVPLEGRPLRDGAWLQGDVFEGLGLWRTANSCSSPAPTGYAATGPFLRRSWACVEGSALELAMFPGGHTVPSGWADMMVDWFEELPPG